MRAVRFLLGAILLGAGLACVTPVRAAEPPLAIEAGASAEQLQAAYATALGESCQKAKQDKNEWKRIEEIVHYASRPDAAAERQACCLAMVGLLDGDAADAPTKVWIVQLLTNSGKAEVVPALAKLLAGADAPMWEAARCALQNNPSSEAASALRSALAKTTTADRQVGLILAVGARHDAAGVAVIAPSLGGKDEKVVLAALQALGDIADEPAAKAIAGAKVSAKLQLVAADSHMKCAEKLLAAGQAEAAAAIYRQYAKSPVRSLRMAAMAGALRSAGDRAGTAVLAAMASDDADAVAVATLQIADLSPAAVKDLAGGFGKLAADRRLMLLDSLALRGEKVALPVALACAKSDDVEVRKAGLRALGPLGDATVVPMLCEVMVTDDPDGVARASLLRVSCPKVNETLVGLLQKETEAQRRAALIDVLDARGAVEVVSVLLPLVTSEDANARRQAMRVLGKLATPEHVAAMLPGLLEATGGERDDAERAVMFVCQRIGEAEGQAAPVLAAYVNAAPADKAVLLSVLGRIGGSKALEVIEAAMASSDTATREAAVRGLSNWPNDQVADRLMLLAENGQSPQEKVMALRAVVRVVTMREGSSYNDKQKVAFLAKAMPLAERDQDKNFILERAGSVRHADAFRMAVACLDDPATCVAASKTVCELAHHGGLRGRDKAEYEAALRKVVELCKDKGVVQRAQQLLRGE
jgi:HEAT repeat protein